MYSLKVSLDTGILSFGILVFMNHSLIFKYGTQAWERRPFFLFRQKSMQQ